LVHFGTLSLSANVVYILFNNRTTKGGAEGTVYLLEYPKCCFVIVIFICSELALRSNLGDDGQNVLL
jgi:hypothetical protein